MYPTHLFEAALRELSMRRAEAQRMARARRAELIDKFPRLGEIEDELGMTGLKLARASTAGASGAEILGEIRYKNLALQKARAEILALAGLKPDYLEPPYFCRLCEDTGFVEGKRCSCLEGMLKKATCERYFGIKNTGDYTLQGFSLDYYSSAPGEGGSQSPRQNAQRALDEVRSMLSAFPDGRSLLLLGGTGLGKTHLSVAAAAAVVQMGYTAAYTSAQSLIDRGERERFGRSNGTEDGEFLKYCADCDLLVIDDLGSEYTTPLSASILFNLINTRLLEKRGTIISSNCTVTEMNSRYSDRLVSRLFGDFRALVLTGRDIRLQRRMGGTGS